MLFKDILLCIGYFYCVFLCIFISDYSFDLYIYILLMRLGDIPLRLTLVGKN